MVEHLCRICAAKIIREDDAIQLFDNQNKSLLLQLKDLTGVRLKNNLGLPKLMCFDCKNHLISAYKFRDDFLKVQSSFKIRTAKSNKKQTCNALVEATEFVQLFVIKEEKNVKGQENTYEANEEKEINIGDSHDLIKKHNIPFIKESKDEINALELNPNEENTLEDTKISIEEAVCDITNDTLDMTKNVIEDEDLSFKYSEEEYISKTKNTNKDNSYRKGKTADSKKNSKTRKKRKTSEEHPSIFICDQCGNHFTCSHHFKLHLRRHSGDKRCACELCPDKFFTSSELRRHMRRHTGERPFACKYCDRRFTDYSTRIKHERTHTNERPFMCTQCGKSFTTSYILKNHMLTHTGERHFKCDICNRSFTRRTHLVVHFRSIMHKQAIEKAKRPISQEELPQATHTPTFIV